MFRAWIAALIAALVVSLSPTAAHAEGEHEGEARALFQAGTEALHAGRFEEAIEYVQRAHELSGRIELYYNIAIAADRLRRDELALSSFETYLEGVPDTPRRPEIERRIETLRRVVAEKSAAEEQARTSADASPRKRRTRRLLWRSRFQPGARWCISISEGCSSRARMAGCSEYARTATMPEMTSFPACADSAGSYERKALSGSTAATMEAGAVELKGDGEDSDDNSMDFVRRTTADPQNSASATETP